MDKPFDCYVILLHLLCGAQRSIGYMEFVEFVIHIPAIRITFTLRYFRFLFSSSSSSLFSRLSFSTVDERSHSRVEAHRATSTHRCEDVRTRTCAHKSGVFTRFVVVTLRLVISRLPHCPPLRKILKLIAAQKHRDRSASRMKKKRDKSMGKNWKLLNFSSARNRISVSLSFLFSSISSVVFVSASFCHFFSSAIITLPSSSPPLRYIMPSSSSVALIASIFCALTHLRHTLAVRARTHTHGTMNVNDVEWQRTRGGSTDRLEHVHREHSSKLLEEMMSFNR